MSKFHLFLKRENNFYFQSRTKFFCLLLIFFTPLAYSLESIKIPLSATTIAKALNLKELIRKEVQANYKMKFAEADAENPSSRKRKNPLLTDLITPTDDLYKGESEISLVGLRDFSHYPFVTIDNDDSRDLDQALFIEKNGDGTFHFLYAIADASYFVKEGSTIDLNAQKKIFTAYLYLENIPLLPRILSENLCSLVQGKTRRALIADITINQRGETISKDFHHGFIINKAKLSYRVVQEFYDRREIPTHWNGATIDDQVAVVLDNMRELGQVLIDANNKIISFEEKELHLKIIEENGSEVADVSPFKRYQVEKYNERLSILANSTLGIFLREQLGEDQSIHRYHENPSSDKWEKFYNNLKSYYPPHIFAKVQGEKDLTKIEELLELKEHEKEIFFTLLNSANYSVDDRGHYGLQTEDYDQFTAPMRRYTDIVNHRILLSIIGPESGVKRPSKEFLERIANRANLMQQFESTNEKIQKDILIGLLGQAVDDFSDLKTMIKSASQGKIHLVPVKYPFFNLTIHYKLLAKKHKAKKNKISHKAKELTIETAKETVHYSFMDEEDTLNISVRPENATGLSGQPIPSYKITISSSK